jgi:hypothetical protein
MTVELSLLIAVIGCVVGLAGWLTNRDKSRDGNAEWRGEVNGKLDGIMGIRSQVDKLDERVNEQGERIAVVEASAKSAHHRLDEHLEGRHGGDK